ncbi:MAG: hypothetical protein ABIO92_08605 [Chloroflexia bacterium]
MKKHLWWVAIVALGFALVGQYSYRYSELSKEMIVHVAYPPVASFREVTNKASTIVQAEVISIQAGPDNVTKLDPQSGEPNQESRLPTQLITVRVSSAEKGNTSAGQELVIHRTGGEIQSPPIPARGSIRGENRPETLPAPGTKPGPDSPVPPPPPARVPDPNTPPQVPAQILNMEGDPAYAVGERVFLALEERPGAAGVHQPVHPAGRYRVQANNVLQAVFDDDVSQSVAGRQVAEAARAARGEVEIPTRPRVQRRVTTGETEPGTVGMPRTGSDSHTDVLNPVLFIWLGVAAIALGLVMGLVSLIPSRRRIR